MARILDSLQEVGRKADSGKYIRTALAVQLTVSIIRKTIPAMWQKEQDEKEQECEYYAQMTFSTPGTRETIAIDDRTFSSVEELATLLGIEEDEEVWEVLE